MMIVTMVLEFNYGEKPTDAFGSIWLFNGDGTADTDSDTPLREIKGWVKMAGPMDLNEAAEIHAALKRFFEANSVRVVDIGMAD